MSNNSLFSDTIPKRKGGVELANSSTLGHDPPVNDPLYRLQEPYLEFAGIPAAWKRLASAAGKRERVTVALIDTGVQPDHLDLVQNLIEGYDVIKHTTATPDRQGHGTMMAGVLGATINNTIGIAGVMDLVNIMPISLEGILRDELEADSVDYTIRNKDTKGIKIILMAISDTAMRPKLTGMIKEAVAAGLLVIVTAGNQGEGITENKRYPCALTEHLPGILCVTATENTQMRLTHFSNYGDYVDIAAPGSDIESTCISNLYNNVHGTSPAAAIVAGVAAMLYSINPTLTPVAVKGILKDTSKKGIKLQDSEFTLPFGLVDADAAVAKVLSR
ncbi:hypothetical protein FOL47_007785 [Perkinsus chesapeaki]|uniref:subtilisin n=1 Tax=Perkinsus chesapeaki TaxID=330153 RepID=A0A7J6LJ38_PERCH|nr:hypothetical protein FOL47_007785 [Perkinsus chesapeaki]